MAGQGHNSVAGDRLRSIVERYERLAEEKKALTSDQADIMAEAKGAGFDVKVVRELIKLRAQETAERKERASLLEIYANAIGLDLV